MMATGKRDSRGRPSKLDEPTRKKLLDAIKGGHTLAAACAHAGIHYATMRRWVLLGEQATKGEYFDFCEDLKNAEETAKMIFAEQWKRHFPDSWQAIATYMERRWPEEYGRRDRQTVDLRGQVSYSDTTYDEQFQNDPESRALVEQLFERRRTISESRQN